MSTSFCERLSQLERDALRRLNKRQREERARVRARKRADAFAKWNRETVPRPRYAD